MQMTLKSEPIIGFRQRKFSLAVGECKANISTRSNPKMDTLTENVKTGSWRRFDISVSLKERFKLFYDASESHVPVNPSFHLVS